MWYKGSPDVQEKTPEKIYSGKLSMEPVVRVNLDLKNEKVIPPVRTEYGRTWKDCANNQGERVVYDEQRLVMAEKLEPAQAACAVCTDMIKLPCIVKKPRRQQRRT